MRSRCPRAVLAKLAEDSPLFRQGFELRLNLLILGLEMFTSGLKLFALDLGLAIAFLPLVAVELQILESAFEQLEFILGLLAFLFPFVATRFEECYQFPQGTSKLNPIHDSMTSLIS